MNSIAVKQSLKKCTDDNSNLNHSPILSYGMRISVPLQNMSCQFNCHERGDCHEGVCFCEVEFTGKSCENPNFSYYLALSTIYYIICATSFIQLLLCINSEYKRIKPRSYLRCLKITTQKALYFFICLATAIRGFYFSSPTNPSLRWADGLMSAYYPLLLSGSSLIVCFWAEVFHLYDVSVSRPTFLSKSFSCFVLFNVVTYSLLLAELLLFQFSDTQQIDKSLFAGVFNSIYAILMLIVVIFFLIYGVEVFFKVRGAFIQGETCPANIWELHQSRIGLVSQATMLLVTVLFLFSEVVGGTWKKNVPVSSRNVHQLMFRIIEIGVAMWFPCVLWNCLKPERLWILNPRRILKRYPSDSMLSDRSRMPVESELFVEELTTSRRKLDSEASSRLIDCWICYDSERKDVGPLIYPCACKGDVSAVHHDCLLQWLMESHTNPENVRCKVCKEMYLVKRGQVWFPSGLTIVHWSQTVIIIVIMSTTLAGAYVTVKLYHQMTVRTLSVGCAILIEYLCLRFLGFNVLSAYHRAKFSALKIISRQEEFTQSSVLMYTPIKCKQNSHEIATVSESIPIQEETHSDLLFSAVKNPIREEETIVT